jgi:hypothetical protein
MRRERCYEIPDGEGAVIRVHASKRPDERTVVALQDLFAAAKRKILARNPAVTDISELPHVCLPATRPAGAGHARPPRSGK